VPRWLEAIALWALLMSAPTACAEPVVAPTQAADAIPGSVFAPTPSHQSPLPVELREISGLATTADGRLFAHDDEHAIIYELDAATGRVTKRFSVGAPEQGDFEGLAIDASGAFWMTTSAGQLMRFSEGADGASVTYERFDAGLDGVCEVEGLAFLPANESLILACKRHDGRGMRNSIVLYEWRAGGGAARVWRTVREAELVGAAGVEHFRPSSVEVDARSGRLLLLSARDAALAELGTDGALQSARTLRRGHVQAEGLAVLPNGALVISDEGGDARALLSVYDRAP
jgi:uncharacterized protein YjiK